MYCKEHALKGMVDVRKRQECSHDSCTRRPTFDIKGSNTAVYCKQHAVDGMVNVDTIRCSHNACNKRPVWGVLIDGLPTVCAHHKSDIVGDAVINFRMTCRVNGCRKCVRWGLAGKQPTHCRDHGPGEDTLVCTVGTAGSKRSGGPSYRAVRSPSFRLKTECLF